MDCQKLDTDILNQDRIFHYQVLVLKCQYIWMNPWKCDKYCFLSGVIAVLKNSFHNALKNWMLRKAWKSVLWKLFQYLFHHQNGVMVCDSMN